MVEEVKGSSVGITMRAEYKKEKDVSARGYISRDAGTKKVAERIDREDIGGDPAHRSSSYDGALHIGEQVRFSVVMPKSGWLRLFNFGSSGRGLRLYPGPGEADRHFRKGETLFLPDNGWFVVNPPATGNSGAPDRLFAIVVEDQDIAALDDLEPRLEEDSRGGFGGEVEGGKPAPLIALPPEEWEYGLLEYETKI